MSFIPVLFEDHNLVRFRPLAWSTPLFELRCGMFNVRERVAMVSPSGSGLLLSRCLLDGLHRATGWRVGPDELEVAASPGDSRFLFLSGRLAPDARVAAGLFALDRRTDDFLWLDQDGLVAALLSGERAVAVAKSWRRWEADEETRGVWTRPEPTAATWPAPDLFPEMIRKDLPGGAILAWAGEQGGPQRDLSAALEMLASAQSVAPRWIWDIVPATAAALTADLDLALGAKSYRREPFGVFTDAGQGNPAWARDCRLVKGVDAPAGIDMDDPGGLFLAEGVDLAPGTAIRTEAGPVVLDRDVRIMPHCYLEGPLYIGPGSLVKPGSRIHGESSFGVVNRIAGEIGESTFGDFSNKQHEGFIGHAVLGSWINLGAMTTCSDLKNNYGEIRVDLGWGAVATGRRFVGLLMGDHAKTAIGTLFNTGTSVGFASNIFGAGMPPKHVANFRWGGGQEDAPYAVDRALATAETVMHRRDCVLEDPHRRLFSALG